MDIVT